MAANPFVPFRICMSDGKTCDITNHDMMWAARNAALIGISRGPEDIAERFAQCAILRITRIEDHIPAQAEQPFTSD
ncbi:MAG TPA: hypothetical protein VGO59_00095 [Verrucomicrobiae bacterium]|jgi:hypothetical protein